MVILDNSPWIQKHVDWQEWPLNGIFQGAQCQVMTFSYSSPLMPCMAPEFHAFGYILRGKAASKSIICFGQCTRIIRKKTYITYQYD